MFQRAITPNQLIVLRKLAEYHGIELKTDLSELSESEATDLIYALLKKTCVRPVEHQKIFGGLKVDENKGHCQ